MNNLPIELIQYINYQLDLFDQLNLKGISQWFYKCIQIKLPYLLTFDKIGISHGEYQIIPRAIHRLDEFIHENEPFFYYGHTDCEVIVLNPKKYSQTPPKISEFDYFDYYVSQDKDLDDYIEINEDYARECCYSSFRFYGGFPDDKGHISPDIMVNYGYDNEDSRYELFNRIKFIRKCIDRMNEIIEWNNNKKKYIQECIDRISKIYSEMH